MGLCSELFYKKDSNETLSSRITLTEGQVSDARKKKDDLLAFIKTEISTALNESVKHWLQGSYKNHTLIRPIAKDEEYDIDVGLYVLCNAEEEGLSALDVKQLNRDALQWYSKNRDYAVLEDSKTSCERLRYPASFHIDIPIYYYDESSDVCRLATQNDDWVDSDPKALQDWFDNQVSALDDNSRAQLRRIIKYLKAWTAINGGVTLPSIAITVLVATYFVESDHDDDSFIKTSLLVMDYVVNYDELPNPVQDGDLFGFSPAEYLEIQGKANALIKLCEFVENSGDSYSQYCLWSTVFEHMFPPFVWEALKSADNRNLPVTSLPAEIRVTHKDKNEVVIGAEVTNEITVCRDEHLCFSIENKHDYDRQSKVHWIVRNRDSEASRKNDMGHKKIISVDEECEEFCSYNGVHYMECFVFENNMVKGVGAVKVRIRGLPRPVRNPPRKRYPR